MDGAGGAAARGEALDVQRRAAGQHRPHDLELRVGGAAPLRPREPRGLHRGHVGGHRRPPGGRVRVGRRARGARAAARRATARRSSSAATRRSDSGPPSASAGQAEADGTRSRAARRARRRARSTPTGRTARPARARRAWNASSSGCASRAGSASMPSGVEGATITRSRPSGARPLGPQAGVVGGEVERRRRLAGQLERPAAVVATEPRRRAPPLEQTHERVGPEVLMQVGRGHAPGRIHTLCRSTQ